MSAILLLRPRDTWEVCRDSDEQMGVCKWLVYVPGLGPGPCPAFPSNVMGMQPLF